MGHSKNPDWIVPRPRDEPQGGAEEPEQGSRWTPGQGPGGAAKRCRYFCQVRFLWRLARSFLRRLCLLIFAFRRFFSDPIQSNQSLASSARFQYTILLSGYSMIPSAPAALSWGMISRTTRSSRIVSTATQPGWLSDETVGLRKAGSVCNTFGS